MKKNQNVVSKGSAKIAELEKTVGKLNRTIAKLNQKIAKLTKTGGEGTKQIYLDEQSLAKRLGMSVKTLQNWRTKGEGPKFTKFNRAVRYRLRDIVAYEKALATGCGS